MGDKHLRIEQVKLLQQLDRRFPIPLLQEPSFHLALQAMQPNQAIKLLGRRLCLAQ